MQGRSEELSIEEFASNLSTYKQQLQQVDLFLSISNSNKAEDFVVVYRISSEDIIGHVCKGSAHTRLALTPAEVLVAIHAINPEKDGLPLKKVVVYISPPKHMHDIIDDNGPEMSDE